ncbi:MAG: hypothetical protein A3F41_04845 [Coxiella sp. RIFCSPHIGHO2_12_FULL_44_14]|nr:MAG: hypothetical protein A3F41_04845 [Coxiella sp. RIFCSPHIGHO2_12_FULL_44_14]
MLYHLPAEWQPQSGIMFTWPHANSYWDPILAETEKFYAQLIREIAIDEKVLLICYDEKIVRDFLKREAVNVTNVRFCQIPSNDVWARDHGPITVLKAGKPLLLDFTFNAWGDKYQMPLDNLITQRAHAANAFGETPIHRVDFILEGGSIETDGHGTLLTTRRCLLGENRNKTQNEAAITAILKKYFGFKRILWLSQGHIPGDDTDAHIDTLARFCDPYRIVYQGSSDPADEFYPGLQAMVCELQQFKNYRGNPYRLVELPGISPKMSRLTGDRLPASYANFLITNKKVIVPTYDDPSDEKALAIIADCFPGRKVVGLTSLLLIENFGSIHCISMQLPEGVF